MAIFRMQAPRPSIMACAPALSDNPGWSVRIDTGGCGRRQQPSPAATGGWTVHPLGRPGLAPFLPASLRRPLEPLLFAE